MNTSHSPAVFHRNLNFRHNLAFIVDYIITENRGVSLVRFLHSANGKYMTKPLGFFVSSGFEILKKYGNTEIGKAVAFSHIRNGFDVYAA